MIIKRNHVATQMETPVVKDTVHDPYKDKPPGMHPIPALQKQGRYQVID